MSRDRIIDIKQILNDYSEEIKDEIRQLTKEVAIEGTEKLKKVSSPYTVRTGKYNKGWSYDLRNGATYTHAVIRNKKVPSLTHLLEYGHVSKNQYGEWGIVKAYPHIEPIEKYCIKKYEEEIKKIIEKAGK